MVKKILLWAVAVLAAVTVLGFFLNTLIANLGTVLTEGNAAAFWEPALFLDYRTYLYGLIGAVLIVLLYFLFANDATKRGRRMLKGKAKGVESALENSRFMTDKERDFNF
ncbi:MAG TPA: hypothetical protein IAC64_10635, partial [Candidatus Caccomorpha excrementavium]|nr:hypothetical protein [Candidatus Caccomorpha excrementavium]